MGLVFEATHARLSGRYAVKVLHEKLCGNPEALARFDREARVTSSLQHPNIVQVIDFNTAPDGTEYLVMELLDGETLAKRLLWQRRLTIDQVVEIVSQIAAALSAAHAQGIVHRDLKPDNVLLVSVEGRDGELVKVLDFGISKVSGTSISLQGKEGTLFGTPQYMAPEQCEGRVKDVGPAADQFALAAISYELLTGRPPFWGDSLGDILSHIIYDEPAPMHVGAEVEEVVRCGLAKSPTARYPSIAAFAEALRTAATSPSRALCKLPTLASSAGFLTTISARNARPEADARPEGARRPSRWSSSGPISARGVALAAVLLCVGATLAVGHAEGGSAWLAGRRSAAAELSPFLASLPRRLSGFARKLPPTPARVGTQVERVDLRQNAPASPGIPGSPTAPAIIEIDASGSPIGAPGREGSVAEDSIARELIGGDDIGWKAGAPGMGLAAGNRASAALALAADGRRPAARLRRDVDRPSRPVEHLGDRVSGILPASAPRLEPPPLDESTAPAITAPLAGPVDTGSVRAPMAAAPVEAQTTAAPAERPHANGLRRLSVDEDAPLPLDESGGEAEGNRPLGLVE
jgi:serine/threonine-protein kinase